MKVGGVADLLWAASGGGAGLRSSVGGGLRLSGERRRLDARLPVFQPFVRAESTVAWRLLLGSGGLWVSRRCWRLGRGLGVWCWRRRRRRRVWRRLGLTEFWDVRVWSGPLGPDFDVWAEL